MIGFNINTSLRAVIFSAFFFTFLSCSGNSYWVSKIKEGDYSEVVRGRVPYSTRKIVSPSDYDDLIRRFREVIEENSEVMEKIISHFFPETSTNLTIQYDFSSLDETEGKLILRYFARIPEPKVFAGIAMQFVVDLKTEEVLKIYTVLLPLE